MVQYTIRIIYNDARFKDLWNFIITSIIDVISNVNYYYLHGQVNTVEIFIRFYGFILCSSSGIQQFRVRYDITCFKVNKESAAVNI